MTRKDFKPLMPKSPARKFISYPHGPETEETELEQEESPAAAEVQTAENSKSEGYRVSKLAAKTKHLHLLVQPKLFEAIKAQAKQQQYKSVNDFIHTLLYRACVTED